LPWPIQKIRYLKKQQLPTQSIPFGVVAASVGLVLMIEEVLRSVKAIDYPSQSFWIVALAGRPDLTKDGQIFTRSVC
jgi:hypothetical protein